MVLQTIDKIDLFLFLCDRWFENVERDYFTGSVPLSSDKSQSFKDFFVFYQSEVREYGRSFSVRPNNSNMAHKIQCLISIFLDSIERRGGSNQFFRNVTKVINRIFLPCLILTRLSK